MRIVEVAFLCYRATAFFVFPARQPRERRSTRRLTAGRDILVVARGILESGVVLSIVARGTIIRAMRDCPRRSTASILMPAEGCC